MLLIGSLRLSLNRVILAEFSALEKHFARVNVDRAIKAVESEGRSLREKTGDWAFWNATYDFIENREMSFVEENVTTESFDSMNIQGFALFDKAGELIYSTAKELEKDELSDFPPATVAAIRDSTLLFGPDATKLDEHVGLLRTPDGLAIISALPILNSDGDGPMRGTFVFLRWFNQQMVESLGQRLNLALSVTDLNETEVSTKTPISLKILNNKHLIGYGVINDLLNRPVVRLNIDVERKIYSQGLRTEKTLLTFMILAGIFVAVLLLASLEISVLRRFRRLIRQVDRISVSGEAEQHQISVNGTDELAGLGRSINKMLASLSGYEQQLKEARDSAETANKAKSRFVANISHEIRTPINGILGIVQALQNIELESHKQHYLSLVSSSARSLLFVVNDLLDFSKLEAGKVTLDSEPFSLRRLMRESMTAVASLATSKKLNLILDIDPSVPDNLIGDALRLRQVLVNLVGNAIKFTEAGFVRIGVNQNDCVDGVLNFRFEIEDSGIGIPADKQAAMFEAFQQADGSITKKYGGTGLGLNITRQLVDLMGGSIFFATESGCGTFFVIDLAMPLAPLEPEAQEASVLEYSTLASSTVTVVSRGPKSNDRAASIASLLSPANINRLETTRDFIQKAGTVGGEDAICIFHLGADTSSDFASIIEACKQFQISLNRVVAIIPFDQSGIITSCKKAGIGQICLEPYLPEELIAACLVAAGRPLPKWLARRLESFGNQPAGQREGTTKLRPLRILIADDVKTNQIVLKLLVEQRGHQATIVGDGGAVIETLKLHGHFAPDTVSPPFDLILMDSQMPVLNGEQATVMIRESEKEFLEKNPNCRSRHIPIVAVTARAQAGEREKFVACGMDDYMTKPIEGAELDRVLEWAAGMGGVSVIDLSVPAESVDIEGVFESMKKVIESASASVIDLRRTGELPTGEEIKLGDQPLIDLKLLEDRLGSAEFIPEMIECFIDEQPKLLEKLEQAVATGNGEKISRAAHAVKGSLGNIAGDSLAALFERVELAGKKVIPVSPTPAEISVFCSIVRNLCSGLEQAFRH